jgi:cytochrome c oxidase subunit 2
MQQLSWAHEYIIMYLVFIFAFITYAIGYLTFFQENINRFFIKHEKIETIWTGVPGLILIFIAVPSIKVLYAVEEIAKPLLSLKVIGHQWYWRYQYSEEYFNFSFDSFMKQNSSTFRLLEVSNNVVLPFLTQIRLLVSSDDVIHSWTVPCLGVKLDGRPGRVNIAGVYGLRRGRLIGQCSEICGVNHSFIPIVVEIVSLYKFLKWCIYIDL